LSHVFKATNEMSLKNITRWIGEHDDKGLFIFLYIGISLILSIAISLFWLLIAVILHFGLEVIRQSKRKSGLRTIVLESLWETKVDFALVVFALCLAVYLDFIFGVAGLGAATRVGVHTASRAGRVGGRLARFTTRFAAWQRIIRSILISLDDVFNAARFVHKARKMRSAKQNSASKVPKPAQLAAIYEIPSQSSWSQKWSWGDYVGVGLLVSFVLLVVLAPWIANMSYTQIVGIIGAEFHPFP
jgi:hypothetical protein